jgi:biotin-dependent carboxylase-like uncharacterized protein
VIVVERAPPYLTVQDEGRTGYRTSGVPRSGAMDLWSLAAANLLVGNPSDLATLEWAIGAGSLRFERDAVIALAGADVEATVDDSLIPMKTAISVRAGQRLTIHRLTARRFLYVAVRGGVDCPRVLGSGSTYLPAAFGGIDGRRVARGDAISIGDAVWNASRIDRPPCAVGAGPDYDADVIRVIAATAQPAADDDVRSAPQRNNAAVFEAFVATGYTVSAASDRTGYRLEGDRALDAADTSITSEPVCPGVIQLPPGGNPIVLMADSPTIGGYRILGTVISSDLPILAQSVPGRRLRFASVSVDVAQKMLRERRDQGVSEDM